MPFQSNIKDVRAGAAKIKRQRRERAAVVVGKISKEMRDNIKANISKPTFPGYAITGALARKVVASSVTAEGNGWAATVRVQLTGKQRLYARIHEIGGIIKAKNVPYLVFKIGSRWIRVQQVTIRAKGYFSKGVDRTRRAWNRSRLAAEFFKGGL